MDKRNEQALRKMILVKNYLRDIAKVQLMPASTKIEQERGRKLYGASKALEEMVDEAVSFMDFDKRLMEEDMKDGE